jgi:archaellum biogenesis protein FlaJ (TadC family)
MMSSQLAGSLRTERVERQIRLAAILISLGLLVLLLTLLRIHPLAFVSYAVIACPLVLAGIALFLHATVSHEPGAP